MIGDVQAAYRTALAETAATASQVIVERLKSANHGVEYAMCIALLYAGGGACGVFTGGRKNLCMKMVTHDAVGFVRVLGEVSARLPRVHDQLLVTECMRVLRVACK